MEKHLKQLAKRNEKASATQNGGVGRSVRAKGRELGLSLRSCFFMYSVLKGKNELFAHVLHAWSAAVATSSAVQGQTQEAEDHGSRPLTGRHIHKLQTGVHTTTVLHLCDKQLSLTDRQKEKA